MLGVFDQLTVLVQVIWSFFTYILQAMNVNPNPATPAAPTTPTNGIGGDGSNGGTAFGTMKEDSRDAGGGNGGEDEEMVVGESESFSNMQKSILKQVHLYIFYAKFKVAFYYAVP